MRDKSVRKKKEKELWSILNIILRLKLYLEKMRKLLRDCKSDAKTPERKVFTISEKSL